MTTLPRDASPENAATASRWRSVLLTYSIAAGSAILFSSKGVFVKLCYRHGVDPITVLVLRMGLSLPAFALMAWWGGRGRARMRGRDWAAMAGLGFIGYYLSSLVNFTGLQYVSVGLERITLFSYPTLVLVFTAIFLRKPARPAVWVAAATAWLGIAIAFAGEVGGPEPAARAVLGTALVFSSAICYAVFLMAGEPYVRRLGPLRFTGMAVGFSCLFMIAHYLGAHPPTELLALPRPVYVHAAVLALFGTVLPSILMGFGLKRAGPTGFAVVATIGPVATIFLAWAILGEVPGAAQWAGFALALGGGVAATVFGGKR